MNAIKTLTEEIKRETQTFQYTLELIEKYNGAVGDRQLNRYEKIFYDHQKNYKIFLDDLKDYEIAIKEFEEVRELMKGNTLQDKYPEYEPEYERDEDGNYTMERVYNAARRGTIRELENAMDTGMDKIAECEKNIARNRRYLEELNKEK